MGEETSVPRPTAGSTVPAIVFHGDRDTTVHPCNSDQVIAQCAPSHAGPGASPEGGPAPCGSVQARCDFLGIPPGTYALAVIHDENRNGKLDTNWLGDPAEGYGFSSGAKITLSAPSFSDASFQYDGGTMELEITLNY